ncbi:8803_t:CDS:10 [Acaulospora morrowiae]|uniref:8803_t:CDS:1 n=1 Tax=Acaulospora morrowiae TaxID=94023 RepID=A0A9N9A5W3_9GLOM|nr:8803_t:CDS:10 [Acaulospora morrowiae]
MSRRNSDLIIFDYGPHTSHYHQVHESLFDSTRSSEEGKCSNNVTSDHDLAVQLQLAYDEENFTFQNRGQADSTSASEDVTNDENIARQLNEELNGSNIRSVDISSLGSPNAITRIRRRRDHRNQPLNIEDLNINIPSLLEFPEAIYFNDNLTEGHEEPSGGLNRRDLNSIIFRFKTKLHQRNPDARKLRIQLSSRNSDIMFTEFISAIRQFKEKDFILKPEIVFRNEPALDAGGVFNDTVRQILEIFMSLENPEYGGDGHLFTGDSSKLISSTAPVHFMDELDAFGDVLFLAVIHNAPFPNDLDITLFKYCLNMENTISLDDLKGFSMPMYNLARRVYDAPQNVNLSTIEGFDQWAEEKEINAIQMQLYSRSRENLKKLANLICEDVLINSRINQLKAIYKKFNKFGFFDALKAKKVTIEDIKNYFYREIVTPNDIIRKLTFDENLNHRQRNVRDWLIDWLRMQDKTKLQEFCRLVTGFKNPRERIKVSFKAHIYHEPRELQLTPKFVTCFQEMKISEGFSSRQEFCTIMNAQVDQSIHDNRFTTA